MEITSGTQDRARWVSLLRRIATPVLTAAAERRLRATMPVEAHNPADRARYTHLEAVGRLLAGLAPWLACDTAAVNAAEAALIEEHRALSLQTLDAMTDPASPDLATWGGGGQPLVDAAFLAHALLRAPNELFDALTPRTRRHLLDGLRQTREITPGMSNWLLFSAMVEAALFRFEGAYEAGPVERALQHHEAWYKGDGAYGDGPAFHWDYYNSFVIQPMLLDVLQAFRGQRAEWDGMWPAVRERAVRYAAVQERLVAPDGSFPVLGRSMCYRCGAFQHLAQMALRRDLPAEVPPAQARGVLTAVVRRTLEPAGTFDDAGWLRLGLAGHQPSLAEGYISTGSLYLCATAFLPLGLPPGDAFWHDSPRDWTSRRAWSGEDLPTDKAIKG